MSFIHLSISEGIASLALNRPDKRNALDGPLIKDLSQALKQLVTDSSRVLILYGEGKHFCAGGDLAWMQKMVAGSSDENYQDAQALADLLYHLYHFPKPSIALVQGAAMGGGLGLLAAADIAIASSETRFALPEVKLGLVPSIISPYLLTAISERLANYYFLTGEAFGVDEAKQMGLIHQIVEPASLMSVGVSIARTLLENGPRALASAKQLLHENAREKITEKLAQKTAENLAEIRSSAEGQEGIRAFLEKRKPRWDKCK